VLGCAGWVDRYASEIQHLISHNFDIASTILDARRLSYADVRILSLEVSGEDIEEEIIEYVTAQMPQPPSQGIGRRSTTNLHT
jgi:hypothetical protein